MENCNLSLLASHLATSYIRQAPGRTRSMPAPSCELWRSLRKRAQILVDVSDIFYFFCSGEGKGVGGPQKGGGRGRFFIENFFPYRGGGGAEGPGGCLRGNLGGWQTIFFGARNAHQEIERKRTQIENKRAQKGAKEPKRALPPKNCKKKTRFGTTKFGNSQHNAPLWNREGRVTMPNFTKIQRAQEGCNGVFNKKTLTLGVTSTVSFFVEYNVRKRENSVLTPLEWLRIA